ncbi:GAF domain-containing protein [Azospirillum sp. BE72]|nr:GAF domain-containing protein [Azospirillum sp. BE72]
MMFRLCPLSVCFRPSYGVTPFQARLPTLIADLTASPEFRTSALLRDNGLRSVLCVPVISGGVIAQGAG